MKQKSKVTQAEQDAFLDYLVEMDDVLAPFIDEAKQNGFQLDFSLASVSSLEQFLLSAHYQRAYRREDRAARYLGEVIRRNLGGQWELGLVLFGRLPVIAGYSKFRTQLCPIQIVGNFLHRKEPGMIVRALDDCG